ncbi:DNA replication and repair protein RadC [Desulfurobacterium pacificum]|uniref:DNA replication and repair protein RadC n=1 Tax=Desulfurobacterium pacificum TaxID=240166 RepID=A0ABY1NSE3_9BACT|nr:DNA repair protein RadC [Desulfurobacterium pacificum]SMP16760.1 DNA replication and repair protein RadC [Desulfurobacterium pacificum]
MSYYTVKELPESDRPREKLLKVGAENLLDSELLAIILRTGVKGKNVLDLSREILKAFGGFEGLSKVHVQELIGFKGLGKAKAVAVKAAVEIGRRTKSDKKVSSISTPPDAFELLRRFGDLEVEVFGIVTLNVKNVPLGVYEISKGSVNAAVVTPKEVFRPAVRDLAASVILFHNHPSGDTTPSSEDLKITQKLKRAAQLLDIEVLDHVIIGRDSYFSFREEGILDV